MDKQLTVILFAVVVLGASCRLFCKNDQPSVTRRQAGLFLWNDLYGAGTRSSKKT